MRDNQQGVNRAGRGGGEMLRRLALKSTLEALKQLDAVEEELHLTRNTLRRAAADLSDNSRSLGAICMTGAADLDVAASHAGRSCERAMAFVTAGYELEGGGTL